MNELEMCECDFDGLHVFTQIVPVDHQAIQDKKWGKNLLGMIRFTCSSDKSYVLLRPLKKKLSTSAL